MMRKIIIGLLFLFVLNDLYCQPGKDGALTITSANSIVNKYYPLSTSLSAGSFTLALANAGLSTLCSGDLIMIYQAQGASVNFTNTVNYGNITSYNSAGLYEFQYIQSITGNIITTQSPFTNSYSLSGRPQIIKVPQYTNLTINSGASIIPKAWKDTVVASVTYRFGGLTVIHASTVVNNGTITADGFGFRGGVNVNNTNYVNGITLYVSNTLNYGAEKGEGIFGYQTDYDLNGGRYCRGAAANGGGGANTTNASGGGGANGFNGNTWTGQGVMIVNATNPIAGWMLDPGYIANSNALTNSSGGGRGGYSWALVNGNAFSNAPGSAVWSGDSRREIGGLGGRPLTNINPENRIYFGGGGGGGDMNNFAGNSGSNGGGIVYIISSGITGSGTISSNGLNVPNTTGWNGDGNGGAGAGGSIILKSGSVSASQNITATGGQGGTQMVVTGYVTESEGPGGGGGGGLIASVVPLISSVAGGPNGITNSPSVSEMPSDGGTQGAVGQTGTLSTNFISYNVPTVTSNTPCTGSSLSFTCNAASTYTWSGPAGFSSSLQNPVIVNTTTLMSGTYSVTLGNGNCISPVMLTLAVIINPGPTLIATADTTICPGQTVTLSATGATSYTWNQGAITVNTFTVNPTTTTVYTVTGNAGGGCIGSAVTSVIVSSQLSLTVNSGTICSGNSFTINPVGASTYTFSGGSAIVTPNINTNYTITGSNAQGCTGSITSSVTVLPSPTLTANSGSVCIGNSFTLVPTGAVSYSYSGGSAIVSPVTTSSYTITASNSTLCPFSNSVVCTVTVIPKPTLTINSGTICSGNSFTISSSGALTYTYSGGSAIVAPLASAHYTVTGANAQGCTDLVISSVTVIPQPTLSVNSGTICSGNSFTINPLGANTYTFSGGTQTVTPAASTVFTITGSNAQGCTGSVTSSVNVIPQPTVTINSGSVCAATSFTINPSGAGYYTYSGGSAIVTPATTSSYTIAGSNSTLCPFSNSVVCTVTVVPGPLLTVNNGTICEGSSFVISPAGASAYTFSGGFATVSPGSNSTYTITGINLSGCSSSVTASVNVIPKPAFNLSAVKSTLCLGESTVLNVTGNLNYTWNTGETTNSISVTPTTNTEYSVTGTNTTGTLICSATQTILVTIVPQTIVSVFGEDSICFGQSVVIYAIGAQHYSWSPAIASSSPNTFSTSVNPVTTTIYTVTASNATGCPARGTIQVVVNSVPYVNAGVDTTINIDESYILSGTGNVEVGFLSPQGSSLICNFCATVSVNPKETTCYILKGENGHHCEAFDEVCINVKKDWDVFIPNTFTPNGDGNNDIFIPIGYGIAEMKVYVFDRWGVQIFKSSNEIIGWDGQVNGKISEQGTYSYKVKITTMGGTDADRVGHINLIGRTK